MTSDRSVSILGCGWLGLPLAKTLLSLDFEVGGSTREKNRYALLQAAGIKAIQLDVTNLESMEHNRVFFDRKILIVTLPFKRSFTQPGEYKKQIDAVIRMAEQSLTDWVIFTSSTSIYSDGGRDISETHP
ncbi:MAG: nucleoside-diphosphate-sugar epimerase, partial [Candidatus Marinamargulisbacteria bacterium]